MRRAVAVAADSARTRAAMRAQARPVRALQVPVREPQALVPQAQRVLLAPQVDVLARRQAEAVAAVVAEAHQPDRTWRRRRRPKTTPSASIVQKTTVCRGRVSAGATTV